MKNQNVQIDVYRDPNVIAAEINLIKSRTQTIVIQSSIEIGTRLKEAKELVAHGQWGDWLKETVNYSQRTANNLMKIADEMGSTKLTDSNSQALANLSYTQAIALLRLDSEERENFVEEHDLSTMSTRELEDAIKERNEANKQRDALMERMKMAMDEKVAIEVQAQSKQEELDKRDEAVKALEKKLKAAEKKLKDAAKGGDAPDQSEVVALKAETESLTADLTKQNAEIEAMREELEKAKKAVEQANIALEEKPKEIIKEVTKEVVPEDVKNRLADLENKAKLAEHTAKFKAGFEVINTLFTQLVETVDAIGKMDEAEHKKYKKATNKLLDKLKEQVG